MRGYGTGSYTIPAAKIVVENGKVYALDKDERALRRVYPKAEISGVQSQMRRLGIFNSHPASLII